MRIAPAEVAAPVGLGFYADARRANAHESSARAFEHHARRDTRARADAFHRSHATSRHLAGSSCQRCSLPEGHSLCRFDARAAHALTFPSGGAGDVALCAVEARGGSRHAGFAGVALSDNAGSDWADVTSGEHAVVNFAEPSVTTRAARAGGGLPVGLPATLSGAGFGGSRRSPADGGNRVPFACAFDGRAAPTALDEDGGVSSAMHRCEVPPRDGAADGADEGARRTAAVLPPGAAVAHASGDGARAAWTDVPWTRAGAVTVNERSLRFGRLRSSSREARGALVAADGSFFAPNEAGGDAFVVALVPEDDDDVRGSRAGGSASARVARVPIDDRALDAVGCAFGTTRVAVRADGDGASGAVFCASPAAKRPVVGAAFFGVGARFAERMTVEVRRGASRSRGGAGAAATARADAGRALSAIVGRRGSLDVSALGGTDAGVACAVAVGASGGWVAGGPVGESPRPGRFAFFCDTPVLAAAHAGFAAVRAAAGGANAISAGESLGQISARAAPAARGATPAAAATGGDSVNVPVFVTGKDLIDAGETAWCVARGDAFGGAAENDDDAAFRERAASASFARATPVSSALVACPPPDVSHLHVSSSPGRLEIVPVDVAAGTPTGGAFYAESSVELDIEAHGDAARGGGGAALVVPEEGGATVFAPPGGARVAPSGCDFGTIVGVSARLARAAADEISVSEAGERSSGPGVERAFAGGRFACASPAMRARRVVPTRAAFPSRSRRDADVIGLVAVRRLDRRDRLGGFDARDAKGRVGNPKKSRGGGLDAAARLAFPAVATARGGSPVSVALSAPVGVGVFFCVFAADAAAGFEARRVVVPVSAVPSAKLALCETPPAFERTSRSRRPLDVAHGAVKVARAAEAFAADPSATDHADAAVFAWVARPAVESAAPASGTAEGGVLVSVFGSGLDGGARPAAWFGAVGPTACRAAGDADEASGVASYAFYVSCVSPASAPTRGAPAQIAASATGDARTRSAFGDAATYTAVSESHLGGGNAFGGVGFETAGARWLPRAETRRVVAPAAAPVGGGAVLWLIGSGFRGGATERDFRRAAGFAFADVSDAVYGNAVAHVGACVPVSSVLAACEAPARAAPTGRARARLAFAESAPRGADPAAASPASPAFPDDFSASAPLAIAAPCSVSRVSPPAVPAGGGAAVLASLSAPAGASTRLGCAFGSVGPVAGWFAADARDAVSCLAPARAPSLAPPRGDRTSPRTLVPVAVTGAGSGAAFAWADAGAAAGGALGVAYVGGDAVSDGARSPRAVALPSAVAARAPALVRVLGAGAHFLRAAAALAGTADGMSAPLAGTASAACSVGGAAGASAGGGVSGYGSGGPACRLVPGSFRGGRVFRAAWIAWGGGGGARVPDASFPPGLGFQASGAFELLVAAPPRVAATYPAETSAEGGGVAFVVGSGFALAPPGTADGAQQHARRAGARVVFGAHASGASATAVVCSAALVDVVSSALARVETPDFFAAGVDAVTGDDGRAGVAVGVAGASDAAAFAATRRERETDENENDAASVSRFSRAEHAEVGVLVSRRRPTVSGTRASSPRTLSPAGGAVIALAGDALRSAVGGCACFFGTVGPVAAACGSADARCAAPATRPRRVLPVALLAGAGGSHLFATRPPGAAAAAALDASGSGSAVAAVAVGGAGGAAMGALLDADGGAVVYGWGLDAFEGDALGSDAFERARVGEKAVSGLISVARAPGAACAAADPGSGSADVFADGFDGAPAFDGSARPPVRVASGFVACGVASGLLSRTSAEGRARAAFAVVRVLARGEPFAAGDASARATQIATRPRAVARASAPARSPAGGGGVLWVSGADLRSAADGASQAESGPTWSALGAPPGADAAHRRSCIDVDKAGGFAGAHVAVSSALAACEIPPARAFPRAAEKDAGAEGRVAYVEGGDLDGELGWSGDAARTHAAVSPARGSVAGGTPVRVAARAHPGWGGGGAAERDAGCFFGPVAVRARWSTAAEVECVTPSRGITAAVVRVAPVMDHRTRSFIAFGESYATFKYAMF